MIIESLAKWQLEKSNEHKKTKKKTDSFFSKFSTFEVRIKNKMALKLFEFVEYFMMDIFFVKITQFEKTGLIDKASCLSPIFSRGAQN